MYLFHAKSVVDLDKVQMFETDQRERSAVLLRQPGFVHRFMLKDREHAGVYFYTSVWRSKADHTAFKDSEDCRTWMAHLARIGLSFKETERVDCDLFVEDRAPGAYADV